MARPRLVHEVIEGEPIEGQAMLKPVVDDRIVGDVESPRIRIDGLPPRMNAPLQMEQFVGQHEDESFERKGLREAETDREHAALVHRGGSLGLTNSHDDLVGPASQLGDQSPYF